MLKRVLSLCAISATILSAQIVPQIHSWDEAEKVEAGLASNPDNVTDRVRLLNYYSQQGTQSPDRVKPLRRTHILWFIEHHPENSVLSQFGGTMSDTGFSFADADGFAACSAAWQKALSVPKPLFEVFANAMWFYKTAEPARARKIGEDGLKLYPGNARILDRQGVLMAYSIAGVKTIDPVGTATAFDEGIAKSAQAKRDRQALESSDDPNLLAGAGRMLVQQARALEQHGRAGQIKEIEDLVVQLAEHAIQADPNNTRYKSDLMNAYQMFASVANLTAEKIGFYEKALAASPFPQSNYFMLQQLAPLYLSAGDAPRASETASKLLQIDPKTTPNFGGAAFIAHTVLGKVALENGDRKEAARQLLESAAVPSDPNLTANGPHDWTLVADLLGAGDHESALTFFDRLRNLWKNDNGRIDAWVSTIRAGGIPDFSPSGAFPKSRYIGRPAPDFRLKDLKGAELSLAEFKGKVVLLDFWATWCGPCRAEMPEFQKIHRDLSGKDVVVLALDVNEPDDVVAPYIQKEKFTFPVLLANGTDVMKNYSVNAYPTTFAIDKNGIIAEILQGGGPNSGSILHQAIETARAGAPPPALGSKPPDAPALAPSTPAQTAEEFYADALRQHNAKNYAGALDSLNHALVLKPDWLLAVVNHADVLYHLKRYDESISEWSHAIQMDPKRAGSYDGRGLSYSYSHRHEQAIPDYTRAIELNPEFSAAYNNRGWAYLELGDFGKALADLNKSLDLNPTYTTALFNRAHLFEKQEQFAKAIDDYNRILHVEPGNNSAASQKAADLPRVQSPSAGTPAAATVTGGLTAPRPISPAAGAVFDHYPRETTVVWSPVAGAAGYIVEWDFKDNRGWSAENGSPASTLKVTEPVANFQFVGAQAGRWRVWAVDSNGVAGPKSEWREFRYTQ